MGETNEPHAHNPDNCAGLAAARRDVAATHQMIADDREWMQGRFADFRLTLDKELKGLVHFVEDVRRQARDAEQRLAASSEAAGDDHKQTYREVFGRLVAVEKSSAETRPHGKLLKDLTDKIAAIDKRTSMQWIVIVLLSLLSVGKGLAWLIPIIAAAVGGGP